MSVAIRGFSFPFCIDPARGGVRVSDGGAKLRDNLVFLLQVEIGERVLRRDYGGGLRSMLYEPVNTAFAGLIKGQIIKAITQHEQRIELAELAVETTPRSGSVEVVLVYRVKATGRTERLSTRLEAPGGVVPEGGRGGER